MATGQEAANTTMSDLMLSPRTRVFCTLLVGESHRREPSAKVGTQRTLDGGRGFWFPRGLSIGRRRGFNDDDLDLKQNWPLCIFRLGRGVS